MTSVASRLAAVLLFLPLALGCRTFTSAPSEKSDPPATALKVLPDAAPVPEPPIAYLAPPLDASKVFAQSIDPEKQTARIVGLAGAADPSVTRVFAQNKSTGETIDFPVDGGSFQATMANTKPGDLVLLWTGCPDCSAGGPGINSIEKKVQYWHKWFPGSVRSLLMTSSGLFVGDDDGLFFFKSVDLGKDPAEIPPARIFTQAEGLLSNRIDVLADDGQDGIWLGSERFGLSHVTFPDGMSGRPAFTHYRYIESVPATHAYAFPKSLKPDGNGGLLMCSGPPSRSSLYRVSASAVSGSAPVSLGAPCGTSWEPDGQGGFWVVLGSLYHVQPSAGGWTMRQIEGYTGVFALAPDGRQGVWAGASSPRWDSGMIHVDADGQIREYSAQNGFPSTLNWISSLALDPRGGLWVGAHGQPLSYLVPTSDGSRLVSQSFDLVSGADLVILPDGQGRVWVGQSVGYGDDSSTAGLTRFTVGAAGTLKALFRRTGDLPSNIIHAVARDSSGAFWIGTGRGLVRMDPARDSAGFELFEFEGTNPTPRVLSLALDTAGNLWAGTERNGVYRIDPRERKILYQFATANGLSGLYVDALEPSGSGGMWVGTDSGLDEIVLPTVGLPTVVRYRDLGFSVKVIHSLKYVPPSEPGKDGALWVGDFHDPPAPCEIGPVIVPIGEPALIRIADCGEPRWESGIYRIPLVDGRPRVVSKRLVFDAFPNIGDPNNHGVGGIEVDGDGGVWFGSDHGLVHVRRSFYVDDPTTADGLPSPAVQAIVRDERGGFWVGTAQGLAHLTFVEGVLRSSLVTTADGLPSNSILSLLNLGPNELLIGTMNGLAIYRD